MMTIAVGIGTIIIIKK